MNDYTRGYVAGAADTKAAFAERTGLPLVLPFAYTTLKVIRRLRPCQAGWTRLLQYLGKTEADDEPLSFFDIWMAVGIEDTLWCLPVLQPQLWPDIRLFRCRMFEIAVDLEKHEFLAEVIVKVRTNDLEEGDLRRLYVKLRESNSLIPEWEWQCAVVLADRFKYPSAFLLLQDLKRVYKRQGAVESSDTDLFLHAVSVEFLKWIREGESAKAPVPVPHRL